MPQFCFLFLFFFFFFFSWGTAALLICKLQLFYKLIAKNSTGQTLCRIIEYTMMFLFYLPTNKTFQAPFGAWRVDRSSGFSYTCESRSCRVRVMHFAKIVFWSRLKILFRLRIALQLCDIWIWCIKLKINYQLVKLTPNIKLWII